MPSLSDVKVTISTVSDTKGVDDTNRSLRELDEQSSHSSGKILDFGKAAKVAAAGILALGTGTVLAGKSALSSAADFQQTRIGLENMLGSADAARKMLKDVSQFAAETPFEFPELADATRQLVAFGFSGNDAFNTMKQLGDVSAAIGAPIGDLSYLMGTLKAQGRAFTVDIRQFAQRGIPIYEYLAKVFNTDTESLNGMIEAGKVGFPEVQQAFTMMTAEGGKFHGTMEKQSQSLTGRWSTLKDAISQAGRELVGINQEGDIAKGSLMENLTKALEDLPGKITNAKAHFDDFLAGWKSDGASTVSTTAGHFERLGAQVRLVADAVYTFLKPSIDSLVSSYRDILMPAIERSKPYWDDIGRIVGAVLVGAIWLLINTLNFVIVAIAESTNMAIFWGKQIKASVTEVVNNFTLMWNVLRDIFAAIDRNLRAAFDNPFQYIKTLPQKMVNLFANIGPAIRSVIGNIDIPGPLGKVKDVIPGFATGVHNFGGGMALVGERGPELVDLPAGSSVYTNEQSAKMTGGGASSNTYNIANVNLSTSDAVREFFAIDNRNGQLAANGMATIRM